MVNCQWCGKEIKDLDFTEKKTAPDGSTDGYMHQKCAKQYLKPNNVPPKHTIEISETDPDYSEKMSRYGAEGYQEYNYNRLTDMHYLRKGE